MRVLAWLFLIACFPAWAGRACEEKPLAADAMARALELAAKVQDALDGSRAQAVILARVGSDVSRYGLRWTHAGLAYLDPEHERWAVLHELNECGTAQSALYRQGLANFFLDDPHEYRALVLVPPPAFQRRLAADAGIGALAQDVHEPRYSALAYPFAQDYQNSNGWLLEFLAQADGNVRGRRAAQQYLRDTGFQPGMIHVSPLERLGASLFKANVAFFDHPARDRLRGRFAVTSVESLQRWLELRGHVQTAREISLQEG